MAEVHLVITPRPLETAADLLAGALRSLPPFPLRASGSGRGPRLGIPGGSAVAALRLAREVLAPELWSSILLTWVDERVVPMSDSNSNRGELLRAGPLGVGLELPLVLDGENAEAAAGRTAERFERDFDGALDVALLGLGEDGHVASLFPGHPVLASKGMFAAVNDSPKPPAQRVTLTMPVLARPGVERIIVAMGAGKRDALRRLIAGDLGIPAALLGAVTVVTDQQLTSTKEDP